MQKMAFLFGGLTHGDEDKGATIDWFARYLLSLNLRLSAVIRTNGGSQAAHTVMTDDGRRHIFRQLGSASFLPGVISHLSSYMLVDPISLLDEILALHDKNVPNIALTVDRNARIITPLHAAANRLRERNRGDNRHGSCGQGVGEAQSDFEMYGSDITLTIGELSDKTTVRRKLQRLFDLKVADLAEIIDKFKADPDATEEIKTFTDPSLLESYVDLYEVFSDYVTVVDTNWVRTLLNQPGIVAFEHSQGALLDRDHGFIPYVTRTKTTFANADKLLADNGYDGQRVTIGLLRSYAHRHGPGPFPSYDTHLTRLLPDPNNPFNPWQGSFRAGYFDPIMISYALEMVGGVDFLGIGHLDQLNLIPEWKIVDYYRGSSNFAGFVTSGVGSDRIFSIKLHDLANADYQTALTAELMRAIPSYFTLNKQDGTKAFTTFVSERFGIPIGITSNGPTALSRTPSDRFRRLFQ